MMPFASMSAIPRRKFRGHYRVRDGWGALPQPDGQRLKLDDINGVVIARSPPSPTIASPHRCRRTRFGKFLRRFPSAISTSSRPKATRLARCCHRAAEVPVNARLPQPTSSPASGTNTVGALQSGLVVIDGPEGRRVGSRDEPGGFATVRRPRIALRDRRGSTLDGLLRGSASGSATACRSASRPHLAGRNCEHGRDEPTASVALPDSAPTVLRLRGPARRDRSSAAASPSPRRPVEHQRARGVEANTPQRVGVGLRISRRCRGRLFSDQSANESSFSLLKPRHRARCCAAPRGGRDINRSSRSRTTTSAPPAAPGRGARRPCRAERAERPRASARNAPRLAKRSGPPRLRARPP